MASTGHGSWSAATPGTARRSSRSRQPKSLPPQGFHGDVDVRRGADAGGGVRRPASSAPARASRSPRRTTRRPTTATRCTSTADCRSSRPPIGKSRPLIGKAPHADEIPRAAVETSGVDLIQRYVDRAAHVRHTHGSVRLAFTAMHGVGGEYALDAFVRAGLSDVHVVESQFAPDPDFPTVPFPNPEEPGATDEAVETGRRHRSGSRHRAGPRRRPVRGRGADAGWMAHAHRRRNRLAARRLHPFSDRARRSDRTHRGGEHGGVVADAGRDRRGARRPPRRDTDRLQVAVASRRRPAGLHAGLRLRGSDRLLRRPLRGSRQRRHQCGSAVLRLGRRAARAGTHGARRAG